MSEWRLLGKHATTVWIGQVAVMAYGVTDTMVAGRHSTEALAALSIGSAIYICVSVALFGIIQALLPIWAQLHGAGEQQAIGRSFRQSFYIYLLTLVLGMGVLMFPGPVLRWTQVPPDQEDAVRAYLTVAGYSLAPALLFRLYATFNQSLGRPQMVTWLQVAALGIKIPLSIWLTFGGAGMPAMGAVGCAWATLIVYLCLSVLAVLALWRQRWYQPLKLWRRLEAPDWEQQRNFLRLGIPAGLSLLVEVSSYTLMALFSARLGAEAISAHQIAANLGAVLYMLPLSMGIAVSARVGFWLGAHHAEMARRVAWGGIAATVVLSCLSVSMLWLNSEAVINGYGPAPAVASIAIVLIPLITLYHVADATQSVCLFVLRCYQVTLMPLLIYCVMLWGMGLGGGYWLAYHGLLGWPAMHSPAAFWIASSVALLLVSMLFLMLVWWHTRNATETARV